MKVLVTGGAGFAARYFRTELVSAGYDVVLTDIAGDGVARADLTDAVAMRHLVADIRPDACVHLGAISFVPDAARDSNLLMRVNVGGTENLLAALAAEVPGARVLFVSSAQVQTRPLSAYATSKLEAESVVGRFKNLDTVIARPANHTGPGQDPKFAIPSFIRQAQEILRGERKGFTVGNLESVRDFSDVRDVVHAYRILLEKGERAGVYAISSGNRFSMGDMLDMICRLMHVDAPRMIDPMLFRPTDASPVLDTKPIRSLGWEPMCSMEQTLRDMKEMA